MSQEENSEKEMRLVRGFLPNFDKRVESTTFTYRGLECELMRFTNKENDNWVAGFFPRRFENEVMEPLRQLRLFGGGAIEPITGYLERRELEPDEALKRMKDILKETIDEILDGKYYYELMTKMNKAENIVRRWRRRNED